MKTAAGYICTAFFLFSLIAFSKWYQYRKDKKVQRYIYEILGGSCYTNIFSCIQFSESGDYFVLLESDRETVREIISIYRIDLAIRYMEGRVSLPYKEILDDDFFLISLFDFLSRNKAASFVGHRPMHHTKFGEVYYKLFLQICLACKNNKRINPNADKSTFADEEKYARSVLKEENEHFLEYGYW
jgi:hypothetical protein